MPTIHTRAQMDLLDWSAPDAIAAFDPRLIRGNSFQSRLSRAVSLACDGSGMSRPEIAEGMSSYLDVKISLNILNAYASPSRDDHVISVPRFDALLHVTRDRRLLEFVAADHGWAVIDRQYLPAVELAHLEQHKRNVEARVRKLRAGVRGVRA